MLGQICHQPMGLRGSTLGDVRNGGIKAGFMINAFTTADFVSRLPLMTFLSRQLRIRYGTYMNVCIFNEGFINVLG